VRPEGLVKLKKIASSCLEPAIFRLIAYRLNDQSTTWPLKLYPSLQTAFSVETHLAEGQQVNMRKLTYVPSRNPQADSFDSRRATLNAAKSIY
jgi:hypothetical protein